MSGDKLQIVAFQSRIEYRFSNTTSKRGGGGDCWHIPIELRVRKRSRAQGGEREGKKTRFVSGSAEPADLSPSKPDSGRNVDLPWNPAILEQRIGRAHRMGQGNPVHVYLLATEQTIEENLVDTLAMKQDLASECLI